jgi:hypothetical protein
MDVMDDVSRWTRWDRWPYRALSIALIVLGFGAPFLPFLSPTARAVVAIVGLPVLIAGIVLGAGPRWYRLRKAGDAEIHRNPAGTTVPLDERLATVDHPRRRWVGVAGGAVGFGAAAAWAISKAISTGESAFVGLAIMLFVPFPVLCWLAWRTKALLRNRAQ